MNTIYNITAEAGESPVQPLARMTVNEALLRWPNAIAAINRFGIDTCCGGSVALAVAAADAGISLETLVAAITSTGPAAGHSSDDR